jgi:hypothetical protein
MPYVLHGTTFASKKDLVQWIRSRIQSTHQDLGPHDEARADEMLMSVFAELVRLHPDPDVAQLFAGKSEKEVSDMLAIGRHPTFRHWELQIRGVTSLSWTRCIPFVPKVPNPPKVPAIKSRVVRPKRQRGKPVDPVFTGSPSSPTSSVSQPPCE